jgi:hypothetical protein
MGDFLAVTTLGERIQAHGLLILLAIAVISAPLQASMAAEQAGVHEGVASCGGSTCHGRLAPTGKDVRQNELITWEDTSSAAGSHSKAWQVLKGARAQGITARLGLGPAQNAQACLGCHSEPAPESLRGQLFQVSDGVGCEACHGASGAWIGSHYAVDGTHANNVAQGMSALDDPKTRASVCLDCHFGSAKQGQFVTHKMMAAGHPRVSFELDLYSALQRHYNFYGDDAKRKIPSSGIKFWAVGQAMAVERALTLYGDGFHSQEGAFPEFYFFDCQSCHRRISDEPSAPLTAEANPARPIPPGTPPFDDENMIMLSAVARVVAPEAGARFDAAARSFHAAMAQDPGSAKGAATQLAAAARDLANSFASHNFTRADTFAALDNVLSGAAALYTDYSGGSQAVMAADTLLNSLVAMGQVSRADAEAVRPDIDRLYAAVRDTNGWHPAEFRGAIQNVAAAVRKLQ